MKSKARKQEDLNALTEQLKNSTSAMVLSFNGLTVDKDQQFRNELRESGVKYSVVKNTLARLAVKDTPFEEATEHFVGVTSIALTDQEPVDLSKVVAKYIKEYKDIFEFKTGVVDGKVVSIEEVKTIASLPSKEALIAKLLYLLNAPAQRLATVLNAVPRDLAVVVKQVSERPDAPAADAKSEAPAKEEVKPEAKAKTEEKSEEAPVAAEEAKVDEKPVDDKAEEKVAEKAETADEKPADDSADEQKADEESSDATEEKSDADDSGEAKE